MGPTKSRSSAWASELDTASQKESRNPKSRVLTSKQSGSRSTATPPQSLLRRVDSCAQNRGYVPVKTPTELLRAGEEGVEGRDRFGDVHSIGVGSGGLRLKNVSLGRIDDPGRAIEKWPKGIDKG